MRDAVIVSAVRTPVGRYMGALRDIPAYDLAALVLDAVLKRCGAKAEEVDEVILGQSYQSGEYVNIARMALLKANWPEAITGITIDRRCCTGLPSAFCPKRRNARALSGSLRSAVFNHALISAWLRGPP